MAVIKCVLNGRKLEVVKVVQFQRGDKIKLDKPAPFSGKPLDCLVCKVPFRPGQTVRKEFIVPCPGN